MPAHARTHRRAAPADARRSGVAAIIAMMFLVIFGSLAAAMAIVSQGGLRSAESHLKIGRAHAAAETGLDLIEYRLGQAFAARTSDPGFDASLPDFDPVRSDRGVVTEDLAVGFWNDAAWNLEQIMRAEAPITADPSNPSGVFADIENFGGTERRRLTVGPIRVGPGQPSFVATLTTHPIAGEDYANNPYYARLPYGEPGGLDGGTRAQQEIWDRDTRIKREAGIDFIVGGEVGVTPTTRRGYEVRPLDERFVRVTVVGTDAGTFNGTAEATRGGAAHSVIRRTVRQDYRLTKTIPYALLSRSRVMIGRNVTIDGPLNSRFGEVNLKNGHPVQMESDFLGFDEDLDDGLDQLAGYLGDFDDGQDLNGDNRIDLNSPSETDGLWSDQEGRERFLDEHDFDGDGYLTEFDYFVKQYDADGSGGVTRDEFGADTDPSRAQLFQLLNVDASPATFINELGERVSITEFRSGIEFDELDRYDEYAKVRGQVSFKATLDEWEAGAVDLDEDAGSYHDFFQGPVSPDFGQQPLRPGDLNSDELFEFGPDSFDMEQYHAATNTVLDPTNLGVHTPNHSGASEYEAKGTRLDAEGKPYLEEVPYQGSEPSQKRDERDFTQAYDYIDRPVYRNFRFDKLRIPPGTNALFEDCLFLGVTYIETAIDNTDPNFNYAGIQDVTGFGSYYDRPAEVDGVTYGGVAGADEAGVEGTKSLANNIRFHNCTFRGPLVGGPGTTNAGGKRKFPADYSFTHTRNKVTFTGQTTWEQDETATPAERALADRSSILMPHFSVEMGSFRDVDSLKKEVRLKGTIVAGIIDIRGEAVVDGTIVTTFEPKSGENPVVGSTSPNFNTTLGYFSSDDGDLESTDSLEVGRGRIRLRYDPLATLPDGITSPVTLVPLPRTFSE